MSDLWGTILVSQWLTRSRHSSPGVRLEDAIEINTKQFLLLLHVLRHSSNASSQVFPSFIFFPSHLAPPTLNSVHQHHRFSLFLLKSLFICFFLDVYLFPSFHTRFPHFLFSSRSSYIWSIDCFEYVFNKHKLIGFLFHLQSCEIDRPSPIINSRISWKDPLLLNWFRPWKKSIVCFSYWWKCIAHSSCSVK